MQEAKRANATLVHAYRYALFVSVFLGLAAAILGLGLQGSSLEMISLLPALYSVSAFVLIRVSATNGPSLFLLVTSFVMFLRYVVFPGLAALNGGYEGRSWVAPAAESYNYAILLMCYEMILVVILMSILETGFHRRSAKLSNCYKTLPIWYTSILVLSSFLLAIAFPKSLLLINVFSPSLLADETSVSPVSSFVAMLIIVSKIFIFIYVMNWLSKSKNKKRSSWLALLVCAVNVSMYFGTNRISIVITAVASVLVYLKLFGHGSFIKASFIGILTLLLFSLVTKERSYNSHDTSVLVSVADSVQAYTGGVYNVAIGVEVKELSPEASSLSVLAYDFIRPTIGLNLISQDWDLLYSNVYFNNRMWTHVDRRSQILPMIAQGNLFFPPIFSPLLSLLFVYVGYRLMLAMAAAKYLEVYFLMALVVMRLGFFWGQNSMNMMNYISLNLILPGALIVGYEVIRRSVSR